MKPPVVDVIELIGNRANRFLAQRPPPTEARVILGDSRIQSVFGSRKFRWAITSPPYYGMRTYIPDQWLRNWFVGGPSKVTYKLQRREIQHASPYVFAEDLRKVWVALSECARTDATLVIRFGGIAGRDVDPVALLKHSLLGSGWRLSTTVSAGDADAGNRQATQFANGGPAPREERDYYCILD